ncbi:MAG: phosphatidylserine decarboxylase [SAR324 cluster bacterium]|nr:phosphatidylserine decarboxylase [SAR324 cluster bacterium]
MTKPHSKVGRRFPIGYYFFYLLPKSSFSRLCGIIAELRIPKFLLQPLIRCFIWIFKIDMSDALEPVTIYPTFNAFFTRHLKPESRPVQIGKNILVSPVDGTIGQFGTLQDGKMIQAKGLDYTVADLLDDPARAREYAGGEYITIYLAPYNYHRIHSPVSGHIQYCAYIPGQLWTVSPWGVNNVQNLFPRNERIISYVQTTRGECAVVKVGATVVGKVKVPYHSIETNCFQAQRTGVVLHRPYMLQRGDEIGVFELGSTVVCCFKPGQVQWDALSLGQPLKMGEAIGHFFYEPLSLEFHDNSTST